jgi:hypothetical protein
MSTAAAEKRQRNAELKEKRAEIKSAVKAHQTGIKENLKTCWSAMKALYENYEIKVDGKLVTKSFLNSAHTRCVNEIDTLLKMSKCVFNKRRVVTSSLNSPVYLTAALSQFLGLQGNSQLNVYVTSTGDVVEDMGQLYTVNTTKNQNKTIRTIDASRSRSMRTTTFNQALESIVGDTDDLRLTSSRVNVQTLFRLTCRANGLRVPGNKSMVRVDGSLADLLASPSFDGSATIGNLFEAKYGRSQVKKANDNLQLRVGQYNPNYFNAQQISSLMSFCVLSVPKNDESFGPIKNFVDAQTTLVNSAKLTLYLRDHTTDSTAKDLLISHYKTKTARVQPFKEYSIVGSR